jgi:predicted transposase YbfD/YdcC
VLILERLLAGLKDACAAFPNKRKGEGVYSMADISLSAFSLFFTQRSISKKIIDKKADYIIALKGNQGTLHEDVKVFAAEQKANFQGYDDQSA